MNRFLKTHLHILQLEEYQVLRFLNWWVKHPFEFSLSQKKPLVFTPKINLLIRLTYLFYLSLFFISFFFPLCFILLLLFLVQPFPLLFLSLFVIKPYEIINRSRVIQNIRTIIQSHPHLAVIGITGSFGKTSTKEYLYQILNTFKPTLKTPESYNTLFGIKKVIDLELLPRYYFFICEMGAYLRGEIKEICSMIPPQYALLTAIGTQHLERFKNLSNTTLAKFELIDAVAPQNALVNLDNELIRNHLKLKQYRHVNTYCMSNYSLTKDGADFTLIFKKTKYHFKAPVFGYSQIQNLSAAIAMSLLLPIPLETINQAVSHIKSPPHRLELKKLNQATLIDDTYSSNETGFLQVLSDLKKLSGSKAILTPGIIELGSESVAIHRQIGAILPDVFSSIYLVKNSPQTQALLQGIKLNRKKVDVKFIDSFTDYWPTVNLLSKTHAWILLENDLADQY